MKNVLNILLCLFAGTTLLAQDENNQPKDSVKTEVVNVITSYAPKITDAFKIKRKPAIQLSKDTEKKKLEYPTISVPVASTFIPESGTLKPIKLGKKERLFDNYFSLGFGNKFNPYVEAYIYDNVPFDYEYRAKVRFNFGGLNPANTELTSNFYNTDVDLFYKQIARYFNWKAGFILERDRYNFYGLPTNIDFTDAAISTIDPNITYKHYKVHGGLEFSDSFLKDANLSISSFSDDYNSNEIDTKIDVGFTFPLGRFGVNSEDLQIKFSTDFLAGSFGPFTDRSPNDFTESKYGFLNIGLHPYYMYNLYNFDIRIGAKGYFTLDTQNNTNEFLIYPDLTISYPIIKQYANLYVGAIGDLHNNSFKSLSDLNPYLSPTLNISQTNEVYNAYAGIKGVLNRTLNYNFKARYNQEKSKPFFLLNESLSDGIITAPVNSAPYTSYEFGNSFNVIYDNVQTLAFIGEFEYDFNKHLSLGANFEYNLFTLENLEQAWGLAEITGEFFGVYKTDKWYAGSNIYYVGDRKGIIYDTSINDYSATGVDGYFDINFNGGYHFDSTFSVFLKLNNVTNSQYQRFQNFDTQGLQVLGGFIWKFDAIF